MLPDKPSELIRTALADLYEVENDPLYQVDMREWHRPIDGVCKVCLAGAVMAKRLKVGLRFFGPGYFLPRISYKFHALNFLRTGKVVRAIQYLKYGGILHSTVEAPALDRMITPYNLNRDMFFAEMDQLAADLEVYGL